jgi:HD-GYP domain-containing protein (c-di-GMP phosphodiesterase class II)
MKLSQVIEIMKKFAANGHIDPDLFDVFLREKVWQRYAQRFLDPEQIDIALD